MMIIIMGPIFGTQPRASPSSGQARGSISYTKRLSLEMRGCPSPPAALLRRPLASVLFPAITIPPGHRRRRSRSVRGRHQSGTRRSLSRPSRPSRRPSSIQTTVDGRSGLNYLTDWSATKDRGSVRVEPSGPMGMEGGEHAFSSVCFQSVNRRAPAPEG